MSKKKSKRDRLVVWTKNGDIDTFKSTEYTDYYYDGKVFAVIKDKQWIAMYEIGDFSKFRFLN